MVRFRLPPVEPEGELLVRVLPPADPPSRRYLDLIAVFAGDRRRRQRPTLSLRDLFPNARCYGMAESLHANEVRQIWLARHGFRAVPARAEPASPR